MSADPHIEWFCVILRIESQALLSSMPLCLTPKKALRNLRIQTGRKHAKKGVVPSSVAPLPRENEVNQATSAWLASSGVTLNQVFVKLIDRPSDEVLASTAPPHLFLAKWARRSAQAMRACGAWLERLCPVLASL